MALSYSIWTVLSCSFTGIQSRPERELRLKAPLRTFNGTDRVYVSDLKRDGDKEREKKTQSPSCTFSLHCAWLLDVPLHLYSIFVFSPSLPDEEAGTTSNSADLWGKEDTPSRGSPCGLLTKQTIHHLRGAFCC